MLFIKNRWKVCNVLYAIHVYMFRVIFRFFDIWSLRCMLYFLSLGRFCLITLLSELFHNCACFLFGSLCSSACAAVCSSHRLGEREKHDSRCLSRSVT